MAIDLRRELRKALDERIAELKPDSSLDRVIDSPRIESMQVRLRHAMAERKAIEDKDVFETIKRTGIRLWQKSYGSTSDPTKFSPADRLAVLENGVEAYVAVHGLADQEDEPKMTDETAGKGKAR